MHIDTLEVRVDTPKVAAHAGGCLVEAVYR
jgi:hypothetical protein